MHFAISDTNPNAADQGTIETLVDRLDRSRPTLLGVWAHPDDESYLGAGLMAEIVRRGGTVVNVSATLGEGGTPDPELDPPAQLARRREQELEAALTALGAHASVVLGYADGACDQVADSMGARRIAEVIGRVEPDLILTFGPDGVTGHPDHQAVGRWTRLAIANLGDRVPMLTTAAGAVWPSEAVERMHTLGAFWPGYPDRLVDGPRWTARLDGDGLERKLAALACHESQVGPLRDLLGPDGYRRLAAAEAYCPGNSAALPAFTGAPVATVA